MSENEPPINSDDETWVAAATRRVVGPLPGERTEPPSDSRWGILIEDWRKSADRVRIIRNVLTEAEHQAEVARQRALDAAMTRWGR